MICRDVILYALKAGVFFLFLAVVPPISAGVFKWTDENGQVHYGERPPSTPGQVKQMRIENAPPSSTNAGERLEQYRKEWDASMEESAKRKEAQAAEEKKQELRKKNCDTAKTRLNLFETYGRIYRTGKDGERQFMDEQQRDAERDQAQALVNQWCQ